MLRVHRFHLRHYGVAILSVALALGLTFFLQLLLDTPSYALFYVAVVISARWSGTESGLFASILAILGLDYFFVPPPHAFSQTDPNEILRLGSFALLAYVVGSTRSDLKTAEQRVQHYLYELQISEEHLRIALKGLPMTVFHQDQALRYTWAYPPASVGQSLELLGRQDSDLLNSEDATLITQIKRRVLETGSGTQTEVCLTRNGKTAYYSLTLEPLRNSKRQIAGIIGACLNISDRKQAELSLQKSKSLFDSFLTHSPIALAFLDPDLRYVHINQTLAEMNGLPLSAHLGRTLWQVIPDWAPELAAIFEQVMQTRQPLLGQNVSSETFPPGRSHYGLVNYFPVCSPDGEVLGVGVAVINITPLKQVEQALRQREGELRLITDALPVLIAYVDAQRRYRFVNRTYQDWFGLSPEAMIGQSTADILGKTAYQVIKPDVDTVLAGQKVTSEQKVPYRRGARYVRRHLIPDIDVDGKVKGYYSLVSDITDLKYIQKDLERTNQILRTLIDACPLAIIFLDDQGIVQLWNQAAETILGWKAEEVVGLLLPAVTHRRDAFFANLQAVLDGQSLSAIEVQYGCKDGRKVEVSLWATQIKDSEGNPGCVTIAADITQRKQAEQEREQLLAREQSARAAAETANRVKDEFLAVLSHELRSPLNPILGWVKLLQSRQLNEITAKRALRVIERNAKLQAQLIEDLLDVSRILRGKLSLNICPVNLLTTIETALDNIRLSAEAKSIRIVTQLEESLEPVLGDAGRLQQVVWNLLSNAVKFTPSNGQIEVRLEQVNSYAQIQIKDTGRGIARDFLPYVFDYFRQADSSITRNFGGLGLGLAIVRHLVELHGGTVQAESSGEGQGATFTIRLPVRVTDLELNSSDELPIQGFDFEGLHILAIDDQADMRDYIAFVLEQNGITVTVATSAHEVIQLLQQQRPDILLIDIGMPELDGYTLLRQVRELPPEAGGQTPAIALTAYAGEYDYSQALAAGFQSHLTKPIEPDVLIQAIATLFRSLS